MGFNMDMPINLASLAITPQMLSLIVEIDKFKGVWRALATPFDAPQFIVELIE
jgi:hypothetical protein